MVRLEELRRRNIQITPSRIEIVTLRPEQLLKYKLQRHWRVKRADLLSGLEMWES
jgi:hypothetical protein